MIRDRIATGCDVIIRVNLNNVINVKIQGITEFSLLKTLTLEVKNNCFSFL